MIPAEEESGNMGFKGDRDMLESSQGTSEASVDNSFKSSATNARLTGSTNRSRAPKMTSNNTNAINSVFSVSSVKKQHRR